jgi:hypothetical protein
MSKVCFAVLSCALFAFSAASAPVVVTPDEFASAIAGDYRLSGKTDWSKMLVSLEFSISPKGDVTLKKWTDEVEIVSCKTLLSVIGDGPYVANLMFSHPSPNGPINIHLRLTYRYNEGSFALVFLDAVRDYTVHAEGMSEVYAIEGTLLKKFGSKFRRIEPL